MRKAQDVAVVRERETEAESRVVSCVSAALRQRLGKERMSLWFGPSVQWSVVEGQKVRLGVVSTFFADCIQRMFRNDLQVAVAESVGEGWGFEVVVGEAKSLAKSSGSTPPEPQMIYDNKGVNSASAARTDSCSIPSTIPCAVTVVPLPKTPMTQTSLEETSRVVSPIEGNAISGSVAGDFIGEGNRKPTAGLGDAASVEGPSLRLVRAESERSQSDSGQASRQASLLDVEDREIARLVSLRRTQERRWEDWIVGSHNRLATTGAEMVVEKPGRISPLLIHGPHGVGKSHLAIGLAHRLKSTYRYRRVVCLTGEQFTIEYTESARTGGFASFRKKYRDVEVLVIDDVQFLLGKTGTLIELRNTIDMLMRDQRQIILVADRGLHELAGMGTDLFARLSGGMACAIDPMDIATRRQLLGRLCQQQGALVGDEVLDWVSEHCGSDARVLQGIVHRLAAQQRIVGGALSPDDAVRAISDIVRANQPIVRLRDIEKVVCEAFGLQEDVLRAKSKCQSFSQPRMLAMFLARKYTRTALSEIGAYFGNRQHSTVISAQKKVETWLDANEVLQMGRSHVPVQEILRSLEVTLQVG
jgi:chromosomal replication initiator protein